MNQSSKLAGMLGFAGGAMGLWAGLALGSIRLSLINVNPGVEPRPGPSAGLPGNLGFLFACTIPFVLSLVAWRLHNPAHRASIWLGISLLAFVVAFSPLSIATFLLLPLPDAQCWVLIRSANGQETWESIPYTTSLTLGPGPGLVAESCASDIIGPLEAVLSVSVWVVTVIGLALVLPRAFSKQLE